MDAQTRGEAQGRGAGMGLPARKSDFSPTGAAQAGPTVVVGLKPDTLAERAAVVAGRKPDLA